MAGYLYWKNDRYPKYCEPIPVGSVVTVLFDPVTHEIGFQVDGKFQGVAFRATPQRSALSSGAIVWKSSLCVVIDVY